ncbi:MAG: hypothetical protein HZT43_02880 [Exiguobacterium profundum]|nr:MAG: hypothetical protein HZT43_02880 [Exiguobacterium profundum]
MIRASFEQSRALDRLGEGLRVLMLAAPDAAYRDALTARLQATGAQVEPVDEIYAALGDLLDDPCDYGLFVMDCDSFGGIQAGRRAAALVGQLKHPVPVILLTRDCAEQHFPDHWREPAVLRAPVSAVSLRVGMEQLLLHRFDWDRA